MEIIVTQLGNHYIDDKLLDRMHKVVMEFRYEKGRGAEGILVGTDINYAMLKMRKMSRYVDNPNQEDMRFMGVPIYVVQNQKPDFIKVL